VSTKKKCHMLCKVEMSVIIEIKRGGNKAE